MLDQRRVRARNGDDVPRREDRVRPRFNHGVAAPDAFDEDTKAREEIAHGSAGQAGCGVDAVRAELDRAVGREDARIELDGPTAEPAFVRGAGRRQVDADQLRAELREQDRRSNRAEDVGHGVADGHGVGESLRLCRRQAQALDLVRGDANRSGDRLRAGIQAGRIAHVETGHESAHDRDDQAESEHD